MSSPNQDDRLKTLTQSTKYIGKKHCKYIVLADSNQWKLMDSNVIGAYTNKWSSWTEKHTLISK